MDVIASRLPATIELSLVALIFALAVSIPLGVAAAVKKNTWLDRLATVSSLFGVSLPGFWFGILLLMLFAVHLHLLPVRSEEHTSELQSLMRISYAVFCLKK